MVGLEAGISSERNYSIIEKGDFFVEKWAYFLSQNFIVGL